MTYTPAADYNGSDSFTFKVNDGKSDSASATVSITIKPVDDTPQKVVVKTSSRAISITFPDTDVDGDNLTYTTASQPAHGTLTGTFPNLIYTRAAGYTGADSFTVKANDGKTEAVNTISIGGSDCDVVFDVGGDCKKGLEEAVDALKTAAGGK